MHAKDALSWFEIPAADLSRATRFYETVLNRPMQTETDNVLSGACSR